MAKKPKWKVIRRYLTRTSTDPEALSRGVGLGLFVGFLPSLGFQIVLAFLLAGLFNANKIAAMIGTLVTNPFTTLPLSVFSLWLGDLILPGSTIANHSAQNFEWRSLMDSSGQLGLAYLVGCLALSIVASTVGYGSMRLYYASINANQVGTPRVRK